jgi:hypothetical protein
MCGWQRLAAEQDDSEHSILCPGIRHEADSHVTHVSQSDVPGLKFDYI